MPKRPPTYDQLKKKNDQQAQVIKALTDKKAKRHKRHMRLIAVIIATLPFWCLGIFALMIHK